MNHSRKFATLCLVLALPALTTGAHASGHSQIYGYWQAPHAPCNQPSYDAWNIDRQGVTGYESHCRILSMSKKKGKFIFKQTCDFGMEEPDIENTTDTVEIISKNKIRINGAIYNRCSKR